MRFLSTTSLLRCIDIVLKIRIFHTDVQDLLKVKISKYSFKYRFANIGIEFPPHILYITRDKTFVYSKCFGLRPFINCTCVEIIEISNTLTRTVIRKLIAHISNCKTHFQCLFVMTDNKRVE